MEYNIYSIFQDQNTLGIFFLATTVYLAVKSSLLSHLFRKRKEDNRHFIGTLSSHWNYTRN